MSDLRIGGVPIAKLKVAELKAELEARELSKTGKKDELVARLISFMEVAELILVLSALESHCQEVSTVIMTCQVKWLVRN